MLLKKRSNSFRSGWKRRTSESGKRVWYSRMPTSSRELMSVRTVWLRTVASPFLRIAPSFN